MNRKVIALAGAGLVLAAGGTAAAVAVTADNPVRAIPVNVTFKTPDGAHPVVVNLYGLRVRLNCWAPRRAGFGVQAQAAVLAQTGWSGYGVAGLEPGATGVLTLPHGATLVGPKAGRYRNEPSAAYMHLDLAGPKGNSYTLDLGYGGTPSNVTPGHFPACRFVGNMTSLGH